ncbi:MAG: KpsF/GutQ family sugar-phosphate isomerase [Alphaproteobacteria bacterium]
MTMIQSSDVSDALSLARALIATEIEGLAALSRDLGPSFALAVDMLAAADGYCVVTGVGKSGHIGSKIAATFASTGTPSFFVHPTEASHGDLGMLVGAGVLLAISNSGDTREMRDILTHARRREMPIIGITKRQQSLLGRMSNILLKLPDTEEACPNGLAPTTSTTVTLALGDALAVAAMAKRGFGREDFGKVHPGGKLGLQLQHVSDWLIDEAAPPVVTADMSAGDVVVAVADGGMGCVGVVADDRLVGCITDGDLRRHFATDFFEKRASDIMNSTPTTVTKEMRMADAIGVMTDMRISNVFIVEGERLLGIMHMKDLLKAGYL